MASVAVLLTVRCPRVPPAPAQPIHDLPYAAVVALSIVGALFGVALLVGGGVYYRYRQRQLAKWAVRKERQTRLDALPVHRAIVDGAATESILTRLKRDTDAQHSARARDYDDQTAFELAIAKRPIDEALVVALLINSLPFREPTMADAETASNATETRRKSGVRRASAAIIAAHDAEPVAVPATEHGYAWTTACTRGDEFATCVSRVLETCPLLATALTTAVDQQGRKVMDIASPECKKCLMKAIYLFQRYELVTAKDPVHRTETTVVHFAVDHVDNDHEPVTLKFMRHREHYQSEVDVRRRANMHEDYVVRLLRTHTADDDRDFRAGVAKYHLVEYPFCLVLERGAHTLADIFNKEILTSEEKLRARYLIVELFNCVEHLHALNVCHCALMPTNVVRVGLGLKLIDFDASVILPTHRPSLPALSAPQYASAKVSTAFGPPCMVYVDTTIEDAPRPFVRTPAGAKALKQYRKRCKSDTGSGRGGSILVGRGSVGSLPNTDSGDLLSSLVGSTTSDGVPPTPATPVVELEGGDGEEEDQEDEDAVKGDWLLPLALYYDMWSLGASLYYLSVGAPLFPCDAAGNVVFDDDLLLLAEWSVETKLHKLRGVRDPVLRNLIAQVRLALPARCSTSSLRTTRH